MEISILKSLRKLNPAGYQYSRKVIMILYYNSFHKLIKKENNMFMSVSALKNCK